MTQTETELRQTIRIQMWKKSWMWLYLKRFLWIITTVV